MSHLARVLLIHATRASEPIATPHVGCALLAAVLRADGHAVQIIDYACMPAEERNWDGVASVADAFRPDVIGFSAYTASSSYVLDLARRCKERFQVPIIVGGVHATLYPERVAACAFVDTVVCGEGEGVICEVVADPGRFRGKVVSGTPGDVASLPPPDFTAVYRCDRIRVYPLLLSRGCPYGCSFCAVHRITGRRWRPRLLGAALEEIRSARRALPAIDRVEIHDDCPTVDLPRFKEFLRDYAAESVGAELHVANMRADMVDRELIALLRVAGAHTMCVAAEHGNPEVFAAIGKAERLEDVEQAARLIKECGMALQLCFVIGLPQDTLKRTAESVRLARRLRADFVFWNMAHPFPGTRMRGWFEENGATFYPDDDYCSYSDPTFDSAPPVVETSDFTREQRRAAKFLAAIETDHYNPRAEGLGKLLRFTLRYGFVWPVTKSLGRAFRRWVAVRVARARRRAVGR